MRKFVPFEKMSKKEQREINNSRRNTWGNVNPGSKVIPNKKKEKEKLVCRGGLLIMFTHISTLPSEEGFYVCRCIDKRGNLSYRIDEYKHPSVFQEKYEGVVEGFQLDEGNSLKTEAWMKLNDDYNLHIIKFNKDKKASIMIKGLELNITLGDIKKVSDGNPLIYQYPVTCDWDGEVFTSFITIYEFETNGNYDHKLVIDGKFRDVIDNSNDPFFKEYMDLYFEMYFMKTFLLPDINNP